MSSSPSVITLEDAFPHQVFHERHPKLVERLFEAHPYSPAQRSAVTALLAETMEGVIAPLSDPLWREWGEGHFGTPWAKTPFLWAESYFYRRLLDAVGYFSTGVDPFAPFKTAELLDPGLDQDFQWLDEVTFDGALTASLYGNRADLGFQLLTAGTSPIHDQLVADDSEAFAEFLRANAPIKVTFVLDNAGRELLSDLVFADHLLSSGLAGEVVLHVKPYPYFVSDATATDAGDCLRRLRKLPGGAGDRLHQAAAEGRLSIRTHPFHVAPLSFADMPADLADELAGGLTIFKGDLNYRRLLGDRAWEPTTPFGEVVSYLSGPAVALRILKSDVLVGADADRAEPGWRVSGNYALISAALPSREK
jgi:damage control phosphatase ARMT1-like protein